MRSVPESTDLTMRARIRDSAIELFGANGFARTTVREIAERAGASPALVLHHFGSKDGLRAECDEHVVKTLLADRTTAMERPTPGSILAMLGAVDGYRTRMDYLARMLTEPGEIGDRVFDGFVETTKAMIEDPDGEFRTVEDPQAMAVLLTAYGLVPLILRARLARGLGADPLTIDGAARMTLPALELFTNGLYRDEALLIAAREALSSRSPEAEGNRS